MVSAHFAANLALDNYVYHKNIFGKLEVEIH